MEFDSIKHLGVNPDLFDLDKCSEDYDQGNFNQKHISTFERIGAIIILKIMRYVNVEYCIL